MFMYLNVLMLIISSSNVHLRFQMVSGHLAFSSQFLSHSLLLSFLLSLLDGRGAL